MKSYYNTIKLLIVDDHVLFRKGLVAMLNGYQEFEVIGDVDNGQNAIGFIYRERPDIVLLDVNMPVMNGKETLIQIRKYNSEIKVVMLTMYADIFFKHEYEGLGAHAVLPKETDFETLVNTLRTILKGCDSNPIIAQETETTGLSHSSQTALNLREAQIVKYICNNATNEDIATILKISLNTVKYYRKSIAVKTKSNTVVDLVKYALRNGLTTLD